MMSPKPILILVTCCCLLCIIRLGAADEPARDLWILSGQSNACGRARLPGPEPNEHARMLDPETGKFVVAQDPLPGMGTTGVGPWVAAAQEATGGGLAIDMLGFARGGRPISFWHPGQPGDRGLMPRIAQHGQGAQVFLWYQGEANARGDDVPEYQQELARLVARVREAAGNPDMLAVIVQLGAYTQEGRDFMGLREAQRQFVLADRHALLVPALGRPLKDSVHLNNAGYQELGREIGRAVLRTRHDKDEGAWPGPVLDAAVLAEGGTSLTAHFAEVDELRGAAAEDFAVIDAGGAVRCRALKSGRTTVQLELEREVQRPARLVYAYGEAPKASLTDEAGNRAPAVHLAITTGEAPSDEPSEAPNGAGAVQSRRKS